MRTISELRLSRRLGVVSGKEKTEVRSWLRVIPDLEN